MLQAWIFVLLLAATAFFNFAEMALIAARSTTLAELEDPRAQLALVLKRRPGLFLGNRPVSPAWKQVQAGL